MCACITQEESSRRECCGLQQQLESCEALLADFQQSLMLKDMELEQLRSKGTDSVPVRRSLHTVHTLRLVLIAGI